MMHELQTTTADLTPPELLRRAAEILESITLSLDGIAAILVEAAEKLEEQPYPTELQ